MKTCLIYTVKADENHLKQLRKSLELVRNHLNPFVDNLDILFFCDKGTEVEVSSITKELKLPNTIKLLEFTTKQPPYSETIKSSINGQIAYKNMCRFWSGEIFKNEEVLKYDYYMRLDCDSYITAPFGFNPFEKLEEKNKIYAYISGGLFLDSEKACKGLNAALKQFEIDRPELIVNGCDFKEGTLYYTNFEICRIADFAESSYMDLYNYLDKNGGIYIYRWGDHIIRYAGIHMMLGVDRVEALTGIGYTHQTFINGKFCEDMPLVVKICRSFKQRVSRLF